MSNKDKDEMLSCVLALRCPECGKTFTQNVFWFKQHETMISSNALLAYTLVGFHECFTVKYEFMVIARRNLEELFIEHIMRNH